MAKPLSKNAQIAQNFVDECKRLGWKFSLKGESIVCITKRFNSTNEEFVKCDSEYYGILDIIPRSQAGSIWGTDGGGIGAVAAMNSGVFTMNKSGCSLNVLKALAKLG